MALDRRVRPLNLIDLVLPLFLTGAKVPGGVIVDLGASADEYQSCCRKQHRHRIESCSLIAARSASESTTVVCTTFGTSLAQNSCRSFGGSGDGAIYTELRVDCHQRPSFRIITGDQGKAQVAEISRT
jgi:hypothetical protein